MRAGLITMTLLLVGCQSHTRGDDAGPRAGDAGPPGADAGPPRDAGDSRCTLPEPDRHRAAATACERTRPPSMVDTTRGGCMTDAECTDGINGRCVGNRFENVCSYDSCFADDECMGGPCLCRGAAGGVGSYGANRCSGGDCQTDADCGPGGFCSPSLGDCGDYGGIVGYYCHTCEDECTDDRDCDDDPGPFGAGYCAFNPAVGRWACSNSQCAG